MRKPRNFSASAICTTAYSPPPSCCGQSPSGGLKSLDLSLDLSVFFVPVYGCFEYRNTGTSFPRSGIFQNVLLFVLKKYVLLLTSYNISKYLTFFARDNSRKYLRKETQPYYERQPFPLCWAAQHTDVRLIVRAQTSIALAAENKLSTSSKDGSRAATIKHISNFLEMALLLKFLQNTVTSGNDLGFPAIPARGSV